MTREEAALLYDSGKEKTVDVLVAQNERIAHLEGELEKLLSGLRSRNRRFCPQCFDKQRKIDGLQTENQSLKDKLKYRKKKSQEGYFGSSTPSSKKPVKPNTDKKKRKKPGAKPGHKGHGRKGFTPEEADRIVPMPVTAKACSCGGTLETRGSKRRSVLDLPPIQAEKLLYLIGRKQCVSCGAMLYSQPAGVLPRRLYGNNLAAVTAAMHYVHGIPMGTVEEMFGLPRCSLIDVFHDLAKLFQPVLPRLMQEFRQAAVKHADETPWRTQGQSGYAWVFSCDTVSLFLFRHTRSGDIPKEVFGTKTVPGVLLVDRYSGYSRVPCKVQYCYEHLKRNLQDVVKQFPDEPEVKRFGDDVVGMLRDAMKLQNRRISDQRFYAKAADLKQKIKDAMEADANHEAIRTYQEIFREKEDKMYHWAEDRCVPAHNNRAEKELRPIVIARKISFGSQSPKGRNTREVLASVLNTLRQRGLNPAIALRTALDHLVKEPDADRYVSLLFEQTAVSAETASSTGVSQPETPGDVSTTTTAPLPPRKPSRPTQPKAPSSILHTAALLLVILLTALAVATSLAGPPSTSLTQSSPPPVLPPITSHSPSHSPAPAPAQRLARGPPGQSVRIVTAEHGGDPSSPLRSPSNDTNGICRRASPCWGSFDFAQDDIFGRCLSIRVGRPTGLVAQDDTSAARPSSTQE